MPKLLYDRSEIYGFDLFTLQVNNTSAQLEAKLPPTDTRFRKDIRFWENADMKSAQAELDRLMKNQSIRHK